MRFSCVTACVYPTETAALMQCCPLQVIHTRELFLIDSLGFGMTIETNELGFRMEGGLGFSSIDCRRFWFQSRV